MFSVNLPVDFKVLVFPHHSKREETVDGCNMNFVFRALALIKWQSYYTLRCYLGLIIPRIPHWDYLGRYFAC